ncbi:MAG: Glutaconyl-CoA decarboxylase subunit beta [candidate division BRC1 bacterium ADurb.BinA292]|nr:MAG: Glutaconyl-CoA decarboxylase subunit beta [candidate division BRC1 bacterium ADurb.BinA292]
MIGIGMVLVWLAVAKGFEPLLLVPIGFGVIVGNMPFDPTDAISVYATGSEGHPEGTFALIYFLVSHEVLPPLIFMGIGVLTDFSYMISNPRLILLGAAAQLGVFVTFLGAVLIGDKIEGIYITEAAAAAIGIIGGADGPTSIYIANRMAPGWLGAIAIAAYSYMSLVPVIQPPVMRLLTTRKERMIRMKPPREVSKQLRVMFPVIGFLITCLFIPSAMVLLGMLFLGNLIRESGVTDRLARTIGGPFIDSVTVLLGFSVGLATTWEKFLNTEVLVIFALGAFAFTIATAGGILFAKLMNKFSKDPINPLVGSAGVSAVPMAARVSQQVAFKDDPNNYILMHAMAPNVAGVIGTAVAAGVFIAMLS